MYYNLSKKVLPALLLLASLSLPATAATEGESAYWGVFNSPKGFGVTYDTGRTAVQFDSYILYADLYAVLTNTASTPGIKFSYMRNFIFKRGGVGGSGLEYELFAGPGLTVGALKDETLRMGLSAGISGDLGFRIEFPTSFSVALSFQADIMAMLRIREKATLGFNRTGLERFYYPQLTIGYSF